MRSNLTISSAIALISISSVSMISGSRIEPLAWHTVGIIDRSVGALCGDIGSVSAGAILRPLLAAAETGHYDDMSKGVDFLTCAELRTTGNAQPGNEVPFSSGNIILGAAIGGAQLLLLIGTVWRLRTLLWFGLLGDTVWLLLHIMSLWMPYIRGASPQYAGMYARVFGRTTKLLPNFGNHLAPDAMHILIDVFVIAVIVTLVPYLRSLQSQDTPIVIRGSA